MIRLDIFLTVIAAILLLALFVCSFYVGGDTPDIELSPIQAAPACDKLGPYPYSGGLDMYILICPKGAEG